MFANIERLRAWCARDLCTEQGARTPQRFGKEDEKGHEQKVVFHQKKVPPILLRNGLFRLEIVHHVHWQGRWHGLVQSALALKFWAIVIALRLPAPKIPKFRDIDGITHLYAIDNTRALWG